MPARPIETVIYRKGKPVRTTRSVHANLAAARTVAWMTQHSFPGDTAVAHDLGNHARLVFDCIVKDGKVITHFFYTPKDTA